MQDNPFLQFIDLVTFDASIRSLKKHISQLQKNSIDYKNGLHVLDQETIQRKAGLNTLRKDVDMLERELKELDAQKSHKQSKLSVVSSPKEFFSLQQELETLSLEKQQKDDQLLSLWAAYEQLQDQTDKAEHVAIIKKSELDIGLQQIENQKKSLTEQIDLLLQQRGAKEQKVPADWLKKYQAMLVQVDNPVVPVENGSCSACFYPISQVDLAGLQRHKLLECKGCYRTLYSM